jgi:ankyrin repeat protein
MMSMTSFGTPVSLSVASSLDHGLNGRFRRARSNSVVDAIPLEPLKRVQHMDSLERCFLEAAEKGDKNTVLRCLRQQPHPVNVNCTTMLGQTAIQIAVDNENIEIVELLLKQPDIRIGDALLQVQNNV